MSSLWSLTTKWGRLKILVLYYAFEGYVSMKRYETSRTGAWNYFISSYCSFSYVIILRTKTGKKGKEKFEGTTHKMADLRMDDKISSCILNKWGVRLWTELQFNTRYSPVVDCIILAEDTVQLWTALFWLKIQPSCGLHYFGWGYSPVVDCIILAEDTVQFWTALFWLKILSSCGMHYFGLR